MINMPSLLGYWDIKALAQPIRLLLAFAGEEVEEKRYPMLGGGGKGFDRTAWLQEKDNLGLDFPNLPYYKDEKVYLTQSAAIFNYVARKHNLVGDDDVEHAKIEMIIEHIVEIRGGMFKQAFNPNHEKNKETFINNSHIKIALLEKYLGDQDWFVGKKTSQADIFVYEIIDWFRLYESSMLDDFPKLAAFMDRFEALPQIKAYMKSEQFQSGPVFAAIAHFMNGLD